MTREELIEFLVEIIKKHPKELRDFDVLAKLREEFKVKIEFAEQHLRIIKKLLGNYSKKQLTEIALALEKIFKEENQMSQIGGLNDYIFNLSQAQIVEENFRFEEDIPEALNPEYIESLIKNFERTTFRNEIAVMPKEELIKLAIALEAFERETTQSSFLGGIHDYADRLSKEELSKFIFEVIAKFPELEDMDNLGKVFYKYSKVEKH